MIMKRKTVLVIEDNEMNMKLVRVLLQMGQYDILEAMDAESGIPLARAHKPDLILMDIHLPGMDGLSATRIIKADPALKQIRVIALTSYAMEGDEKKAIEAGCDGYITKPIDTRTFLDTIAKFIDGGR
jgi:CheY-like chemotaxis protein